jgi:hypothetical protein
MLKSANELVSTEPIKTNEAVLVPCIDGLCLQVAVLTAHVKEKLLVQLHWLNEKIFSVDLGKLPQCAWAETR